MQHTLILPTGARISSGSPGPAIRRVRIWRSANGEAYLAPGAVTAARLEMELFAPEPLALTPGDKLEIPGEGIFYLDEAKAAGKILTLTARDCLGKLDKDLTDWLAALETWPATLGEFAPMICVACGLTLETGDFPNSGLPLQPFRGSGITGRQLMKWIAQAACRFAVATGENTLAFRWYEDSGIALSPTGENFWFSRTREAPVSAPDAVTVRRTDADLGATAGEGENPLYITGNYLIDGAAAPAILAQLAGLSYTPMTLETLTPIPLGAVFTAGGEKMLAMNLEKTGGRYRISAVAAPPAESRLQSQYQALSGRTMELTLDLEGLSAKLSRVEGLAENAAAVSLDVEALQSRLEAAETQGDTLLSQSTQLTQRADALELQVTEQAAALDTKAEQEALTAVTEHFRFDADGLTISNSATGMGIGVSQERIVFTGGENPTTVILPNALQTTNLQVGSRLDIGNFALIPRTNGNLSLRYVGN